MIFYRMHKTIKYSGDPPGTKNVSATVSVGDPPENAKELLRICLGFAKAAAATAAAAAATAAVAATAAAAATAAVAALRAGLSWSLRMHAHH